MAKRKGGKRIKSADDVTRDRLREAGVPEHRLSGDGIRDFEVADFTDIAKHRNEKRSVLKIRFPSVVDRWFWEARQNGDPAFQEPQWRAKEHCAGLWGLIGERRLVANYTGVGGGDGETEAASFARLQLAEYEKDIPRAYWMAFENVVRFDMPAGRAGSHLAKSTAQQQAHAKAATGFCLSLIAQWRGY